MRNRPLVFAAVAAMSVIALAGCSATEEARPTITTGDAPSQDVLAMPDGSVDAAVKKLPEIIKSVMEKTGIPGAAVSVVHGGENVFAEGYGVREKGEDAKVDADTVFQIASVSKSLAATVAATQVSQGVVDWTTPVAEYLDGFELADPWISEHVTIGDFFSHRTGLPFAAGDSLEDIGYDRDYVIDHLKYQPLAPFRASYAYANFGVTVGAETVAVAAGTDWATLSEEQLYQPLGMDSTSSRHSDFLKQEDKAILHAKVGEKTYEPLYERNADPQSPAGGVSSTANDMAKWMELVLASGTYGGQELISPEALQPAISGENFSSHPQSADQRSGQYGYGFNVGVQPSGRVTVSHSGAFSLGAATNFQLLPSADLGIVVLTNAGPVGAAEAISAEFMDLVQYGEITRDWVVDYGHATAPYYVPSGDLAEETAPANPAPAKPLTAYVGEYTNDYYGTATVTEKSGALVVAVGPDGVSTATLEPWDGDTFSFVPQGENAPEGSLSSAVFAVTGDAATSMTLDFFNAEPGLLGTWTRVG